MGFVSALARQQGIVATSPADWNPFDDRWYTPNFGLAGTPAGIVVTPETISMCVMVLSAIRFKSALFARCKPKVVRRDGPKRERMPKDPLSLVLRRPNRYQGYWSYATSAAYQYILHGNAMVRIRPTARYWAGDLRLMGTRMSGDDGGVGCRVKDQLRSGELVYGYRERGSDGETELSAAEVLHYRDVSGNSYEGIPTWIAMRNAVGIALAVERHTGSFMSSGTMLAGVLETDEILDDALRAEVRQGWKETYGGQAGFGQVGLAEGGLKFKPIAPPPKDSMIVELEARQVEKILSLLSVPGVCVGFISDVNSSYGSIEAFYTQGGLSHCLGTIIPAFNEAEELSLTREEDEISITRNMDALHQGTLNKTKLLEIAGGGPYMTRNEIRDIEDLDRIEDDPEMDRVLPPRGAGPASTVGADGGNKSGGGDGGNKGKDGTGGPKPLPAPKADDQSSEILAEALERADAMAAVAERTLTGAALAIAKFELRHIVGRPERREPGAAIKMASDHAAFAAWARKFYGDEVCALVMERTGCSVAIADAYCGAHLIELLADGVAAAERWTAEDRLRDLANIVLGAAGEGE